MIPPPIWHFPQCPASRESESVSVRWPRIVFESLIAAAFMGRSVLTIFAICATAFAAVLVA